MDTILKDWLTPTDMELEFAMSKSSQAKYRMQKKIPYSKVGNFVYYSRKCIYEWLEKHNVVST